MDWDKKSNNTILDFLNLLTKHYFIIITETKVAVTIVVTASCESSSESGIMRNNSSSSMTVGIPACASSTLKALRAREERRTSSGTRRHDKKPS